jgi:hypothetical protein
MSRPAIINLEQYRRRRALAEATKALLEEVTPATWQGFLAARERSSICAEICANLRKNLRR